MKTTVGKKKNTKEKNFSHLKREQQAMGVGGCADDIRPTVRQSVVLREMKLYDMPAGLFHLFFCMLLALLLSSIIAVFHRSVFSLFQLETL